MVDADSDGYGADEDCDDTDAAVNPAATEVCDEVDNDCDSAVDDADADLDLGTASTWYADNDDDGYGDADNTASACDQPSGYVADNSDCDDTNVGINPAATELELTAWDEDCDGLDGRELSSYQDDSGDWWTPTGENLVTDTALSTLESGVSWIGYSSYYTSSWPSVSGLEVVNFKPGGATNSRWGNCLRIYDSVTGVLTSGDAYAITVSVYNSNASGSVWVMLAGPDGVNDYGTTGPTSTAWADAGEIAAGDEVLLGGLTVASSSDLDYVWICALDEGTWDEDGVEVTHFGAYEVTAAP
ncbi:hypothetical protein D6827_01030 [Candidatus Parcubacteria bacterium]|nr:MAG: hypothetical protein D6827_01030 [Candidatus Parcubacteria bacterium]